MLRKMKNKKGQIGEILVIVVLIILAVLGVMKFIVPMFDKSNKLSNQADPGDTVKSISIQEGEMVQGANIQSFWTQLCRQKEVATLEVVNGSTTGSYKTEDGTDNNRNKTFFEMYNAESADEKPDDMANYEVSVEKYENGEIETLTFTKQ